MEIQLWQIIILSLYAYFAINESLATGLGFHYPVFAGLFTGIVMGDITLGLAVGGTLQLMMLGVASFGGASVPDFLTGAIVGTVFGALSGKGLEFSIGLAVPVGLLMVQLDILARFTNTILLHKVDNAIEKLEDKKISKLILAGTIPWGLSRALPIFIMLILGEAAVSTIMNYMPEWLMGGLKVAGGVLPVVGIGVLLRYLPTKNYIPYLLIGFFLSAYLKVPMLGVTIVGLVLALVAFNKGPSLETVQAADSQGNANSFEGGFDGDE